MGDRELGSKDRSAWVRLRSSGARADAGADAREEKGKISQDFSPTWKKRVTHRGAAKMFSLLSRLAGRSLVRTAG